MQAAVIREHGGYDKILFEDRPVPTPHFTAHGEPTVLVKVKACGLNHLDTWVRRGVPGHKFPLPLVPGSDIAGVVEAVSGPGPGGDASRLRVGDKVIVNPAVYCGECAACKGGNDHLCVKWGLLGETTDGGCQEYVLVPESRAFPMPDSIGFEQAACIPIAYVTAWEMLVSKARILPHETILIHAAGSAVSVACIQIAKMVGMHIIVTSTSADKLARARALGAHRFIDTSRSRFAEDVRNLTGKAGVDVVVDHIGTPTMADSVRCLKRGGRLVSCGATAGAEVTLDWKHVFFKNIALLGSTYGPVSAFRAVLAAFAEKKLTAVIDSRISLKELPAAHEALETRKVFGKMVVKF